MKETETLPEPIVIPVEPQVEPQVEPLPEEWDVPGPKINPSPKG